MSYKYTYEDVKKFFELHQCQLLSTTYKQVDDDLEYICKCGNRHHRKFYYFLKSPRCPHCPREYKAKKRILTIDFVTKYFQEHNCELLETNIPNAQAKIKYRCQCGKICYTRWTNFCKGKRCKECGINKISGKNNYLYRKDKKEHLEEIKFRKRCYSIISETVKYFNNYIKQHRTHDLLGYTVAELKQHIQSHPNWPKLDHNNFNIDHIYPIKAFIEYHIYDIGIINCLDNLQPLDPITNTIKSDYYDPVKFEQWLISKGITFESKI